MTKSFEPPNNLLETIFAGESEAACLMRSLDWEQTTIGAIASWCSGLRSAVSICLSSSFPACVIWGRELILLYNDAYRSILGDNHPRALGRSLLEFGAEWHDLLAIEAVLQTGQSTNSATSTERVNSNGDFEDTDFTCSYSPIYDETGRVAGIFYSAIKTFRRLMQSGQQSQFWLPSETEPSNA